MSSLTAHELAPGIHVFTGRLPVELVLDAEQFRTLWDMHPEEYPLARFESGVFQVPRWHQAYGRDYEFSGFVSEALPIPRILGPLVDWTRRTVDQRINGVLVNWYDGALAHRISQHKDSPIGRIPGCPIVTVSFGAQRGFQMIVRKKPVTFEVGNGDVIVVPDATNRRFAHAVPHRAHDLGRRISVTLRGFEEDGGDPVSRAPESPSIRPGDGTPGP